MALGSFFGSFDLSAFFNALILGISIASIWLIAALGLTIIYGTAGVINMAHGEFIMLGAYSSYMLQDYFGLPFLLCVPAALSPVVRQANCSRSSLTSPTIPSLASFCMS